MRKTLIAKAGLVVRLGAYRLRVIEAIAPYNIHIATYAGRTHYLDASILTEILDGVWGGVVPQAPGNPPMLLIEWGDTDQHGVLVEHEGFADA